MKAEIISIGDELLVGQVVNTNASWMAEQLNLTGIEVVRIVAIADKKEDILQALSEASVRADVVLLSGGLGPTRDDITKNVLCEYFDSTLIFHEETLKYIENLFLERGWVMSDINRKQAEIPDNCTPIINNNGTAPGLWFEKGKVIYVSMPGVPYEMKAMMTESVIPKLTDELSGSHIVHKTVLTQGIGESLLSERIADWEDKLPRHIKLAYLPQPGIVRLRLTGIGPDMHSLKKEIDLLIDKLILLIPKLVFGFGKEKLEEVIGNLLLKNNATLSTAESCTGGYIAHLITSIPGSSAYFTGSVVAYSNEVKTATLGVKESTLIAHGAVSKQTVVEMAEGIKNKFNTAYSIAVSGIAGPDGGTADKAVGTIWIAVASPEKIITKKFLFGKNRERNIRLAAVTALNMLRLMMVKA
jgi:nicotinamide-nucleotide amidase